MYGDQNYPLNPTDDWDMIISTIMNRMLQLPWHDLDDLVIWWHQEITTFLPTSESDDDWIGSNSCTQGQSLCWDLIEALDLLAAQLCNIDAEPRTISMSAAAQELWSLIIVRTTKKNFDDIIFLLPIIEWHDRNAAKQGPSDVRSKRIFSAALISEAEKILSSTWEIRILIVICVGTEVSLLFSLNF